MKFVTRFILIVGVTLGVAPIFSSVHAQQGSQGSNEARMLLQMQQMQAEIASLRDMIERQQFELQRLQKKVEQAQLSATPINPRVQAATTPQSRVVDPAAQGAAGFPGQVGVEQEQPGSVDADTLADDEKWLVNDTTQTNAGGQASREVPSSLPSQIPAQGELPNYADQRTPSNPNESAVVGATGNDSAIIEQRVITAPPLTQSGTVGQNYPPVEDRSIGAAGRAVEAGSTQYDASTQSASANSTDYRDTIDTGSMDGSGIERSVNEVGTIDARQVPNRPVIAVPNVANPNTVSAPLPQGTPQVVPQTVPQVRAPEFKTAPAVNPNALAEEEYYQQGVALVRQRKFKDAIVMFQQLVNNYPNGDLAGDAHYWVGEAGFLDRDLATSKQYFRLFMDNYPQSSRIPGAMLRTAYIEQEQGNVIEARILLNEIIQFHPSSDAVHGAKNRLADIERKVN